MKCLKIIDIVENFMRLWIIETTIRVNSPRLCQLQPQEAFDVNKQGDEEKNEEKISG